MAQDDETRRLQAEVHNAILAGQLADARAKLAELQERQRAASGPASSMDAPPAWPGHRHRSGPSWAARPWWQFWRRKAQSYGSRRS